MEGLAIRASRPSIFCSLPGLGGDSQRRPLSDGFLRLPASSNAAVNTNLVASSVSFHPISAVNLSAQASLTADVPALSDNIVWHESSICRCDRQQLLQQKGCVIWITGLSGSGKSTVACALSKALFERGKLTYTSTATMYVMDRKFDFSVPERQRRVPVPVTRRRLRGGTFTWTFLFLCASRDPKGLYKVARAGKIKGFTGIDDPYEAPLNCEVVLKHTGDDVSCSPRQMAENIISYLQDKGYLES
ncbi:hypothetical protein DY000_02009205 [Brassica cretica]|uniref:APS kinase domain-containing protein n=1 Tax=Brassica cretica TaxID=69181 RepID=A0ABQ7C6L8_BRACR|nr:hypothetical protein DY000_02009205 [Brassica cretica]